MMARANSESTTGSFAAFWSTVSSTLVVFPRMGLGLLLPLVIVLLILAAPFALLGLCFSALGGRQGAIAKAGGANAEEMASFVYPLF